MGAACFSSSTSLASVLPPPTKTPSHQNPSSITPAPEERSFELGGKEEGADAVAKRLMNSPASELRAIQFEKELRSLTEKKGGSRVFRRMSSTNRIGDIERIHALRQSTRRSSIEFDKLRYGSRGSLDYDNDPRNHEMRYLLETATGHKHLVTFMQQGNFEPEVRKMSLVCMHCWLDCLAYSDIKSPQYRCTKAIEIYNYYVSKASPMYVEVLQEGARTLIVKSMHTLVDTLSDSRDVMKERDNESAEESSSSQIAPLLSMQNKQGSFQNPIPAELVTSLLESSAFSALNYAALDSQIFDSLSNASFRYLVNAVLFQFQMSGDYNKFKEELKREDAMSVGVDIKRRKCRIFVDDFVYIKLLGKGGFARVVHVMKRSTRQHYAMKIQSKVALVKFHGMNEGGLELEKTMIANNPNPFIVDLQYSLQTDLTAILVLGLVGGGDLSDLIFSAPGRRLPEELAKIYTFEIGFALNHLHENGVVFRDLKPSNVLVDDTGHLKLTDMGLAAPMYVYEASKNKPGGEDKIKDDKLAEDTSQVTSFCAIELAIAAGMKEAEAAPRANTSPKNDSKTKRDFGTALEMANEERKRRVSVEGGFGVGSNAYGSGRASSSNVTPNATPYNSSKRLERVRASVDGMAYDDIGSVAAAPWELDSNKVPIRRKSIVGTRAYLAPEMLEQTFETERPGYTKMVDYFALGVTLFEMCEGRRPWRDFEPGKGNRSSEIADPFAMSSENLMKIIQLRQDRKKFPPGFISKLHKIEFPDAFSANVIDLLKQLLERNPEERFDFALVKEHAWMKEVDVRKCLDKDPSIIPAWVHEGIAGRKAKFMEQSMSGDQMVAQYRNFEHLMEDLKQKDKHHTKLSWGAETVLTNDAQKLFADWDYLSPMAIKSELGMIGYDRKGISPGPLDSTGVSPKNTK